MKVFAVVTPTQRHGMYTGLKTWQYVLRTGPRCHGLQSRRLYPSEKAALEAGRRMMEKFK